MHCSLTKLGAPRSDGVGAAAGQIVDYLERGSGPTTPAPDPTASGDRAGANPSQYFADSAINPGRWRVRGGAGTSVAGPVDPEQFRRVLAGRDPVTDAQLIDAAGSARRAQNRAPRAGVSRIGPPDELLSTTDAADLLGVTPRYVRRLADRTAANMTANLVPTPQTGSPQLHGTRSGPHGGWQFTRAEVRRFGAERTPPAVVMAFDLTWSAPKSVSLLWAAGDLETRAEVEAAWTIAVDTGLDYLRRHAVQVRRGRGAVPAEGIYAASYTHLTNRANEPQLHEHVVIANMATADGRVQTLDARPLYRHYKTAGMLAATQLRTELTRRLGVAWGEVRNGAADLDGVERAVIDAFSSRRRDVLAATAEHGFDSAAARQHAALRTRAAKTDAVDFATLQRQWRDQLATFGFDPTRFTNAHRPSPPTDADIDGLFVHLASARGLTELTSTFDRRDVIAAIAEWSVDRLDGATIEDLADAFCASAHVIELSLRPTAAIDTACHRQQVRYSTPQMLTAEAQVLAAYHKGIDAGWGRVQAATVEAALARWQTQTGLGLGSDQVAMVHSICRSGAAVQAVIGAAGSGKTAALAAACRAWEAGGYVPIGAAVNGTAAEVLAAATGISTSTVAALLTRLDSAEYSPLTDRHVVIVDEASTLGTRHHARLIAHAHRAGAALRTIGDPAQHGAVEAGGVWNHIATTAGPERVPKLLTSRRQRGITMAPVRRASSHLRAGRSHDALFELEADNRVHVADHPDELLDELVSQWWTDRHTDPNTRTEMMAEHHAERRVLVTRAQHRRLAAGELTGPPLATADGLLYVGDEVIARAQNRNLRTRTGAGHVRNGNRGVVTEITRTPAGAIVTVDFAGKGPVDIPEWWLHAEIRPGVRSGLVPSYAVTTHAAQGDTYRAGRLLTTERATREGVYVGLTRGTGDAGLYLLRHRDLTADPVADTDPQLLQHDHP